MADTDSTPPEGAQEAKQIECRATKDTAIRVLIIAAMAIGFGIWCYVDRAAWPPPEAWDMEHINEAAGYVFNHGGPYVLIPVGLILVGLAIRSATRRLVADEEGIGYAGKAKVPWSSVTSLDVSELESKQILRLRHGERNVLTLDAYKLRDFRKLVAFVEAHLPGAVKAKARPRSSEEA